MEGGNTLLNHEERLALVGSWEWTPAAGELLWSDNHFRLYGLDPGSIAPSVEYVLDHVHPADKHQVEQALGVMASGDESVTLDYRIVRDDDVVRHFRSTVALVDKDAEGRRHLVGAVQDVTAQDSVARKLAAHAAVSKALDEWQEFDQGAEDLLAGVAIALNLTFGALWVPLGENLEVKSIWHVDSGPLAMLAAATRDERPGRGSPALGRAWESRQPVLSDQPGVSATRQRAEAIGHAQIVAAIAIPAVAVDETLAVLEFFSPERIEPTDRLLRALNGIGHEVGYFLGQRRGELVAPLLTPRELEVLQLAARPLSAVAIAEELHVSPATVKRHFESAYARLGVSDRTAAVAQAMRQGLIT